MIRENKDIKGILISNTEHKISQYADDAELFLDGSRKSFETCINTLYAFGDKSGLKINCGKTCVIWLGSTKNSKVRFMDHLPIEWNPPKFKVLGIWLTNDLKQCSNLNYREKYEDVLNLFRIWIKRQITPIGRIAILKSLILSKLIHLFILLPNPPDKFLDALQKCCYQFVWNKKPDKIKRKTAHKNIKHGGLGIPNLRKFVAALKLSWIRKFQQTNHKWKMIAEYNFPMLNDLDKYGPEIASTFIKSNHFWKDVFISYKEFFYKVLCKNPCQILAEPILYNKRVQIGQEVIQNRNWIQKGVYCIGHFYAQNGTFFTKDQFREKYNINISFLRYAGIRSAINEYIQKTSIIITNDKRMDTSLCNKKINSVYKGSKIYYDILIEDNTQPNCCAKWNDRLNVENDWNKCFLNLHKLSDTNLKWFQARIIHRCLATNVILQQMGITNNDRCNFCNIAKDSISHTFWNCHIIKTFWEEFTMEVNNLCINATNLRLTESLVILGCDIDIEIDDIFYFILILAKQYIYQCKRENSVPSLYILKKKIKNRFKIEEYIARKAHAHNEFILKWMPYKPLFVNTN